MSGNPPLSGVTVLDLSRILAGPTATQTLSDLGAEVIKIERPGQGDDTRKWGPPFVQDSDGNDTSESAYYLSANRGKKSVAVDIANPDGQALVRKLAEKADVLIENFKTGDMARYGLDYTSLSALTPRLIYCSLTGFGQTGPNAHRAGYDFLIQGEAGIMSLTGEADGRPLKVGVGVTDVICGMYALTGILAAMQARHVTGRGQYIDVCLYDTQVAWLINQGVGYLTDGQVPPRRGNDHPMIVPYGSFPAEDGEFIIAIGNDSQFRRFISDAGHPEMADDPRFSTNIMRVRNRAELIPLMENITRTRPQSYWLERLEALSVPGGPINDLQQVFDSPQVAARDMRISVPHPLAGSGQVELIGNPLKFSDTPVRYAGAPPLLGQHTAEVLKTRLDLSEQEIQRLAAAKVIGCLDD